MAKRKIEKEEKRKLTLSISKSVDERLELLVSKTDADSITEVIRRATAVYDHLWSEMLDNQSQVILRAPDGSESVLVLK